MRRALPSRSLPFLVSQTPREPRSNSASPTISSSRFICMLTADCVRLTCSRRLGEIAGLGDRHEGPQKVAVELRVHADAIQLY